MRIILRLASSTAVSAPVILFGILFSFTSALASTDAKPSGQRANVIYGDDNRKDWYDSPDAALRELALSTVALIEARNVGDDVGGFREIKGRPYGPSNQLCADEPFYSQSAAAFCSGFLVGPKTIVTAGHCLNTDASCKSTQLVFGYAYKTAVDAPDRVPASEVYSCSKVIYSQADGHGADFAVVELDREVTGHPPLNLRREGALKAGDGLVVIGHPAGLPVKIADGAIVRQEAKNGFFMANLDTYGGNSGSAVFNLQTKEVEGVLVRGEQDYVWTNGCVKSKVCGANECRGEDVTAIESVLGHL